jgi:hypothetical protein
MGLEELKAQGDFPNFTPCQGSLVICASGASIWDDFYSFACDAWVQPFDIMCVNDMGMHFPHSIKHWYSNDFEMLPRWARARRPQFQGTPRNEKAILHSCYPCDGALKWPWHGGGTSTLGAVFTGLALGYNEVIVCGAPLDNGPHYFEPPHFKTNFEQSGGFRMWQDARQRYFEGKVKAISGNLKRILDGENLT